MGDGDDLTLIDSGTADAAAEIEEVLDGELWRIVLTHWHEDHTGSAALPAARYGAEVVAHRLEAPVIRGEAAGAPPALEEFEIPIRAGVPALPPAPLCRVDREVEDGDVLGFGGGAVVVAVPGHTDGSIAVHLPEPGVLCTGARSPTSAGRRWASSTPTARGPSRRCTGWPRWRRTRWSSGTATRSSTARRRRCGQRPPRHGEGGQPLGRRVQTTVISPETAPSSRWMVMATGNSGRLPASNSATTSAAGRPRVAVAVTGPRASFL